LIRALETAILTASRKSIHPAANLAVKINPSSGKIQAWAKLEVVDSNPDNDQILLSQVINDFPDAKIGDIIDWEVTPRNFGRIAAQTARNAIAQQLRKAEKENVVGEFNDRVGQIINGVVRKFENGNIIIDFQKAEGIMSSRDRVHEDQYAPGDHINALLLKVDINAPGPSLIVTRSTPEFVVKLFEREVSEIHDGTVKIMGIAREAGKRTKIAVGSEDPRIDPVGACIGMRGIRVKRITEELGAERVDIINYDSDIRKYAANALQPAKVKNVEVDEEKRSLKVTVAGDQSKVAFGRKAQNVRLAAKVIGWSINLQSEDKKTARPDIESQIRQAAADLAAKLDISEATAIKFVNNGFITIDGVRAADPESLLSIEGIDQAEVKRAVANAGAKA
ncbi:MAG: transcription termination factor NusA, partial [Lentisphaeria bacterium]|nr:transcription termination factor NusA [Lentisphaeria bacterium]